MYKRMLTAAAAAIIAVLLLLTLGSMGMDAVPQPRQHIVTRVH